MKHRAVVASFIFRSPASPSLAPTHVALFRRSQHPNIRSYRGLLAPISGSIDAQDASPRAAAARELLEETGLVADVGLRLEAVGPAFSFVDKEAGRSWTVWPFGWTLLCGEEKMRLDWEHDGWEWVEVREILCGDAGGGFGIRERCVPRIEESLRRVYFGDDSGVFGGDELMRRGTPAGDAFYSGMQALRDDKENGARVLATRGVHCLEEIWRGFNATVPDDGSNTLRCWGLLRIAGWHLVHSARPSMNAAIGSAVGEALSLVQQRISPSRLGDNNVRLSLLEVKNKRRLASARFAEKFSDYAVRQTGEAGSICIVTLSSSSTIKAALLELIKGEHFKSVDISIPESRPRCEGASFAASLISAVQEARYTTSSTPRVSITIAPDSHLPSLLSPTPSNSEDVNSRTYLLLGADRISPHGAVLNKTLSRSAATLAKALTPEEAGVTVVVLAETDKLATIADLELFKAEDPRSEEREMRAHEPEHGGADEVMSAWSAAGVAEKDRGLVQGALAAQGEDGSSVLTVSIRNETFEWVPARLVDVYITEKGEMGRHEIGEQCVRKTELQSEVFAGLYD